MKAHQTYGIVALRGPCRKANATYLIKIW